MRSHASRHRPVHIHNLYVHLQAPGVSSMSTGGRTPTSPPSLATIIVVPIPVIEHSRAAPDLAK